MVRHLGILTVGDKFLISINDVFGLFWISRKNKEEAVYAKRNFEETDKDARMPIFKLSVWPHRRKYEV